MKKFFLTLCLSLFLINLNIVNAANIKEYPTIAVMNFGNKAVMSQGLRDTDFSAATEYAIYQFSACGWFDLVDYEQLSTIAKIHSVNMSGLVDPSTAVSVGKFAGAQFMVIGNLTGLTTKEGTLGLQIGNKGSASGAKHTVIANVSMRIVDIETGRIVVAGLGKGESASTNAEIIFKKYRNKKNVEENVTITKNDSRSVNSNTNRTSGENENYEQSENQDYVESSNNAADTNTSDTITAEASKTKNVERSITITNVQEEEDYKITIGSMEFSDVQVRNAISKAVRDCIYGNMGLMTTLNGGKKLKIKTGF